MIADTPTPLTDRLLALAAGLAALAHQPDQDESVLRTHAIRVADELHTLARHDAGAPAFYVADGLAGALIDDFTARRSAAAEHGGVVGMRTGLDHLDEVLNGLEAGKLYLLAAMPGAGKTTLALQWAATVAQEGAPVVYVSLENDSLDLARKLACRLGHVSYAAALKGKLDPATWSAAVARLGLLKGNLYLSTPRAAMPDLAQLLADVTAQAGRSPALLVIDYLQAFAKRGAAHADAADVRERIDRLTPALRALGEQHSCAILAISSQNRAGYAGGGMTSMKESGDVEYNGDVVMTLGRVDDRTGVPRTDGLTPLRLCVEKNRQGMTGKPLPLLLHGDRCMIEEEDR